ncbi:probable pectinesterase/pectinesterase inhibitor 17 [Coffea arabica]|uniref:pectinesterase n=1 Tax=Coffea arabica TaxID=13443 RepID=A0A6P6VIB7_COFAR|nr:probable pectinesterase/pectinesterase inhibitor 17 [Coffea arabica]
MELSLVIVILVSLAAPAISGYPLAVIKPWCAPTLHPELCEHFFTRTSKFGHNPVHNKSEFLNMSLQIILDRAINATENAIRLEPRCRDKREKAAWRDCVNFYKETLNVLNKMGDPKRFTPSNVQKWLSTTLTNLQTCEQGFLDFNITLMPSILDVVLKNLTINALALNSGACCDHNNSWNNYDQHGFPTWITTSERRLLQSWNPTGWANLVVAKDGSGDYTTVQDAINAASQRPETDRFVIYVKAGIYKEYLQIESSNIFMVGDGIGQTIITGNRFNGDQDGTITTATSATVTVKGERFVARFMTFRNTAWPENGQAVAFYSASDYSTIYQCSFEGFQDTLYVYDGRQFFRECHIYGTVDFIMGDATVVFQRCTIHARKPLGNQNTITAQSRDHYLKCSGMSFHNCFVVMAPDLEPFVDSVKTYLGRPWRAYARVVFLSSFLDRLIHPQGWLRWECRLDKLYYGEYLNEGPGSSTDQRVRWPGYHVITDYNEASAFTVRQFISGDYWLPEALVPYDPDI